MYITQKLEWRLYVSRSINPDNVFHTFLGAISGRDVGIFIELFDIFTQRRRDDNGPDINRMKMTHHIVLSNRVHFPEWRNLTCLPECTMRKQDGAMIIRPK